MSDERKKPPPRPPYVRSVEPPRPTEPFRNLVEPSHVEQAATLKDVIAKLDEVLASHREIIATQRKHSLQLDGFGHLTNQRFDIFHRELAMLRATVTADHGPRIDQAEVDIETVGTEVKELSAKQKAKVAAIITAKLGGGGAALLFGGGVLLRALAKVYPEYGELIEGILGFFGL